MRRLIILVCILFFSNLAEAQHIEHYTADALMARIVKKDTLYIIHFWATWCGPCVKEMQVYNQLQKKYEGSIVKIILVSLDRDRDYPQKIAKFADKKNLTSEIIWLSDNDPNYYVPRIDETWQGSIPATLIIQPSKYFRQFVEGEATAGQIAAIADKQLSL